MTTRDFEACVVEIIASIPRGTTISYGEVAEEAGFPGASRAVGNILRTVPDLPWWRVVTSTGRLVPGIEAEHTQHLRSEGVRVSNGRVVMGASR